MSKLIDNLVKENHSLTTLNGKWWIAKPLRFRALVVYKWRIKDCVRILRGKSFAVHYKEDEPVKN